MTAFLLFLAGGALGALLVLALAAPGTWPPTQRPRRPDSRRLKQERESWLH